MEYTVGAATGLQTVKAWWGVGGVAPVGTGGAGAGGEIPTGRKERET